MSEINKTALEQPPVVNARASVVRRIWSPPWLLFHLFTIVVVVVFFRLGWWQLRRAEQGNTLSMGYALQWPLFAGFAVFMWFKIVRQPPAGAAGGSHGENSVVGQTSDSAGEVTGDSTGKLTNVGSDSDGRPAVRRTAPEAAPLVIDEGDEEVAAYNRYLARLNAQASQRR